MIYGGMEDLAYYALRGWKIPEEFPWLPDRPTRKRLILRAFLTAVPALLAACLA